MKKICMAFSSMIFAVFVIFALGGVSRSYGQSLPRSVSTGNNYEKSSETKNSQPGSFKTFSLSPFRLHKSVRRYDPPQLLASRISDSKFLNNGISFGTQATANRDSNFGMTAAPEAVTTGNLIVGNISSHTLLYSTFDTQSNLILELGNGVSTTNGVPMPVFTLSKNTSNATNLIGLINFANSGIANGSEKRLSGISSFTDGAINSGSMQFYTTSVGVFSERMRITSAGNVGIGTSTPGRPLEVMAPGGDAARLYRNANSVGWGVNLSFAFNNSNNAQVDYAGVHGMIQSNTAGAETGSLIFSTTSAGSGLIERMRILGSGNVGIGTTNPAKKLHIFGSNSQVFVDRAANTAGNYALLNFATNGVQKFFVGMNADSDPNVDKLSFFDAAFSATAPVMTFTGGNVGIGKPNPVFKLDVQGGSINTSGGLCINGDCKTAWSQVGGASSQWTTGTSSVISYAGGNVGIGTASPASRLHVYEPAGNGVSSRLTVQDADSSAGINVITPNRSWSLYADNSPEDGFAIVSTAGAKFFIGTTGNVGIGTGTPSSKLEVAGNINVTGTGNITAAGTISGGTIKATYQDVAEWVPSSEKLTAGTVVVLDPDKSNQVISSTQSYDTRIAGVISAQPGITLGEQADNKVLVATTGRVRVKVDATRAPIQIGDLLVTSDVPGTAMKSIPVDFAGRKIHMPGTIVGKALEPLTGGQGEILVLLSIQ